MQATQKHDTKAQEEYSNLPQKLQQLSSQAPREQSSKPQQLKLPQLDNSKIAQKLQPSLGMNIKTSKVGIAKVQQQVQGLTPRPLTQGVLPKMFGAQKETQQKTIKQQDQANRQQGVTSTLTQKAQISKPQAIQSSPKKSLQSAKTTPDMNSTEAGKSTGPQQTEQQDKYMKELRRQEKLIGSQTALNSTDTTVLTDFPSDEPVQGTSILNNQGTSPQGSATPAAIQERVFVETFPYSGPIPNYNDIERFIARRVCTNSKRPEKKPYHEYLVKFAKFSYRRCKWVKKSVLESNLDIKSSTQFRAFETRWERNLEKGSFAEKVIDINSKHDDYDESITEFLTPESILYCIDNPRKAFKNESLPNERIYLTKWYGVKVLDSTWETRESLCNNKVIRTFESTMKYPDRTGNGWKREDSMFRRMKEYQKFGIAWAYEKYAEHNQNVIIGDDFGLGKRAQSLFTLVKIAKSELAQKSDQKPIFLVISQAENLRSWQEEIQIFTSFNSIIYSGSTDERSIIRG